MKNNQPTKILESFTYDPSRSKRWIERTSWYAPPIATEWVSLSPSGDALNYVGEPSRAHTGAGNGPSRTTP